MTKIKDLIATLNTRNPEAQVFMMTTRKQPFENYLAGVVGREDMFDQKFRSEAGIAADDVFLVVGKRIRPGSLSAWIVSEHHETISHPPIAAATAGAADNEDAGGDADEEEMMTIDRLKAGMWVNTDLGYGAVKGVHHGSSTCALVTIFAPVPLGDVKMTPDQITYVVDPSEIAQFHHRVPDDQVIGTTTVYVGDELLGDRGDRLRIKGVRRGALLPGFDPDAPDAYVRDNQRLAELGGVTANDRIDALYIGAGDAGFVSTEPRAIDLALFAHLK